MANVLVTGCSSGFGLHTALHFARRGETVFASLRNLAKAGPLEAARDAEKLPLEIVQLDVLDPASVQAAVKDVESRGGVDVLVNNAGVELRSSIEEASEEEIRWQFDTNVFGALRVMQAVLPGMRERKSGTIVNVSSLAGLVSRPYGGLYAASKHALEALSEALHLEVEPYGVRVVLIEPGQYETGLQASKRNAERFDTGPYKERSDRFDVAIQKLGPGGERSDASEVAGIIWDAVHDPEPKLRYLAGQDAQVIAGVYKAKSFEEYEQAMKVTLDWWD